MKVFVRWLVGLALASCFLGSAAAQPRVSAPDTTHEPALPAGTSVIITAAPGLEPLKEQLQSVAPAAFAEILADLPGLPLPKTVDVRLVHQVADMNTMTPDNVDTPTWADGVAFPTRGVIVVAANRGPDPIDVVNTVRHELAHLALNSALQGRVPRWLDEGFAFLHSEDWSLNRIETLTGMAWTHSSYPIEDLSRYFPAGKHGAHRAYTQAYDFVQFLSRRGRYPDAADDGDRWAFRDFLKKIADGKTADAAAVDVYGASVSELSNEWLEDLRQRYFAMPVGLFGAGLWVLAAMLLMVAYLRKILHKREVMAAWDAEENPEPGTGNQGPGILAGGSQPLRLALSPQQFINICVGRGRPEHRHPSNWRGVRHLLWVPRMLSKFGPLVFVGLLCALSCSSDQVVPTPDSEYAPPFGAGIDDVYPNGDGDGDQTPPGTEVDDSTPLTTCPIHANPADCDETCPHYEEPAPQIPR